MRPTSGSQLSRRLLAALFAVAGGLPRPAPAAPGHVVFEVSTPGPAELPANTADDWLKIFLGPGLASGALGAVAPPFYASGLIVGGLLIVPGALTMSEMERSTWQHVVAALQSVRMDRALAAAVERRAPRDWTGSGGPAVHVDLVLKGYGIVGENPAKGCFVADMDLVATRDGAEVLRDRIVIAEDGPTPDAPPAQCASLERFEADDERLVRDTAAEYAEVLAVMAIGRLAAAGLP